ncbi:hypothetical protein ACLAJG_15255 [Klebsiella pneumoniae]|uniref:Uncharacterized protein n=1 Tax=Klebsiella pneumoniae TaxID=573 RepID=A0A927DZT4_KLEPN|nr:hypothetical protein [Klebsiella pneumoniae]AKR99551.1 hypothetical protein H222_09090 [Klebsiella pneumoniae UHKPC33]EJK26297.1 hypothetical protein KPNIH19_06154 [Klebsiella pneumoniae subsp. pneumoniae KPNIH19]AXL25648.1 hypothetical protein AXK17_19745 [Klebsiella pneumoniae]EJJ98069.1 hypothetical protein KPNIH14_06037 [Klebsiella pneumoniae subsp. pneumoniae KPNIH14]EJK06135.1 hypothetical protein KPNIH16_11528 [Klebsiella pneumoniae subsp. pneumoniae KPNIH16]
MIKGIKIFITVVFVILALLSGMMSFMIVGMGVSGSGCGQECFDNMDSAKFISIIFWILAIISGIFAFMDNGSQKKILSNNIKSIDIFADFIIPS